MADTEKQGMKEATGAAVDSIGFFMQLGPIFDEISKTSAEAADNSTRVADLFAKFIGADIGRALEPVPNKPDAKVISMESIASTKERAFDIAKLALIIPLLLSNESRNYLASFLQGLVGAETMDNISTALKAIGVVLAGVFAVKVFKQVSDTISTLMRLSELIGVLFGLTQEENDLEVDDARKKERESWEKRKEKYEKNKSKKRAERLKKLENLRKVKKVVRGLSIALKGTLIAAAAGIAMDVAVSTIIDYATRDESAPARFPDTEDEKETDENEVEQEAPESLGEMLVRNIFEAIPGGSFIYSKIKGKKEESKDGTPTSKGNITSTPAPAPIPTPAAAATKAPPVTGVTTEQAQQARSSFATGDTRLVASREPISTQSTKGQDLAITSEAVNGEKKDLISNSIVNNLIDNRTLIAAPQTQNVEQGSMEYSLSVGR